MLHPSLDINPRGGVLTEERGHPNLAEGASDKVAKPRGETNLTDDTVDPRVVDGVKGFSCVKKEEEPIYAVLYPFEEKGVNIQDVVATCPTGEEPFLGRVQHARHGPSDSGG